MPELRNPYKNIPFADLMLDYIKSGGVFWEELIRENASKIWFSDDLLHQTRIASRFPHGKFYKQLAKLENITQSPFIQIPDISAIYEDNERVNHDEILSRVLSKGSKEEYFSQDANNSKITSLILWRLHRDTNGKSKLQILLGNKKRNNQDFWYPIGGKVADGESVLDALKREMTEEVKGLSNDIIQAKKIPEFISISQTPFTDSQRLVQIYTFSQFIGNNNQDLGASAELSDLKWFDVDLHDNKFVDWHRYMATDNLHDFALANNAKFIVILLYEWFSLVKMNFMALSQIHRG